MNPVWWKKHVRELCSLPAANATACSDTDERQVSAVMGDVFACEECNDAFASFQQLRLHCFKEHGQSRQARYYADASNSCPACLRRYPTRTQLIRHMYNAKKCSAYPDHCVAVPVEEVARLDAEETARILRVAKASAYESCRPRRLENVRGPLLQVFKDCYKGRPIFKVEDISGMG